MWNAVLVFFGAGLGGLARHGFNVVCQVYWTSAFPYSTLIINISGSLLMGSLAVLLAMRIDPALQGEVRLFVLTGLLGGFTTFSAFSLDSLRLIEQGLYGLAGIYILSSLAGSLIAVAAGFFLARSFG